MMDIFVSRYEVRLDERSRLSVPASFRTIIEANGGVLYAYSSYRNQCVEVCTAERLFSVYKMIEQLDVFSPIRDAMATSILSDAEKLTLDSKGRIVLPERLLQYAVIEGSAVLAGKGSTFEIWQPTMFQQHYRQAREDAANYRLLLKEGGV